MTPDRFEDCKALTAVNVAAANTKYASVDGVLFNRKKTTLTVYPVGRTGAYTVPAGVEWIAIDAFSYCKGLTAVTFPASLGTISARAFTGCTGLESVTFLNPKPILLSGDVFRGVDLGEVKLYVPASAVNAYKDRDVQSTGALWDKFGEMIGK